MEYDKCWCKCKNLKKHHAWEKFIDDDSVIMCDEVIVETKTVPINFNEKNATCKIKHLFYLYFY